MIRNYFTISLRNLLKRKGYTALNILGLTIGITCCLLIFQYVSRERSFDVFQKNASRIVRIRLDQYKQGKLMWQSATSYAAIAPTMKKEFPEVENTCRLIDDQLLLSNEQQNLKFTETKGYYADPSSINMLGVDLVRGSDKTALSAPYKMIVSQSMAKKYFGTDDVVGKSLLARDNSGVKNFQISGVFKDYPSNSHLIISYLVSYSTLVQILAAGGDKDDPANTAWGWYDFYTYIQLKAGTNLQAFQAKLPAFADNPIRNGRLAPNIAGVTALLIKRVMSLAADSWQEQLDHALGLVTTGRIPRESGVQLKLMDLLIDAGARPGNGLGALANGNLEAARQELQGGGELTLAAATVLDMPDNIERLFSSANRQQQLTAITAAAFYGNADMVKLLLDHGIDPNGYPEASCGFHGHGTPLHQAVSSSSLECVRLLTEAGASLKARDKIYDGTPSGWAEYLQRDAVADDEKRNFALIEKYLKGRPA